MPACLCTCVSQTDPWGEPEAQLEDQSEIPRTDLAEICKVCLVWACVGVEHTCDSL
jgi:hypothetical protein